MSKFHINPETKEIGKCTASIQECRYGSVPHFDNIQEAYEESEKMLEEEYGSLKKIEKKSTDVDDFSQKIPAGASLSVYIDEGDQMLYNDNIYTVKDFYYERALLAYVIDTEEGEIIVDDYDWYHSSKIAVLKDKQKNAQFKSSYYSPEEFNNELPENTNLAQLDYDLESGMTIKLNDDLLTIEDYYGSNNDDGESFMVVKTKEYGPLEIREEDIPNIRTYGEKTESISETDYDEQ